MHDKCWKKRREKIHGAVLHTYHVTRDQLIFYYALRRRTFRRNIATALETSITAVVYYMIIRRSSSIILANNNSGTIRYWFLIFLPPFFWGTLGAILLPRNFQTKRSKILVFTRKKVIIKGNFLANNLYWGMTKYSRFSLGLH